MKFNGNMADALFFKTTDDVDCEIYNLYTMLSMKMKPLLPAVIKNYNLLLVDKSYHCQSELLNSFNINKRSDNKLVIIAEKDSDPNLPVLLIKQNNGYVSYNWFDKIARKNLLVLFTPGGAEILRNSKWSETFTEWVSFNESFHYMSGLPALEEERNRLFPKLFEAILSTDNSVKLKEQFEKIFLEAIEHIDNAARNADLDILAYILKMNQLNLTCN